MTPQFRDPRARFALFGALAAMIGGDRLPPSLGGVPSPQPVQPRREQKPQKRQRESHRGTRRQKPRHPDPQRVAAAGARRERRAEKRKSDAAMTRYGQEVAREALLDREHMYRARNVWEKNRAAYYAKDE